MRSPTRALIVAFLAATLAFIGATVITQWHARRIDADALQISRDAAPGVQAIAGVRGELHRLGSLVLQRAAGSPVADEIIATSRARLDAGIGRALELPTSPEEGRLFASLQAALRAYDEAAERVLEQVRAGRPEMSRRTADSELRPLAEAADEAALALVEHNARLAGVLAERIERSRHAAARTAYELDAICALLALVAAIVAGRIVRHTHRLQDEHRALVERKAAELEQFAGRVAHDVLSPLGTVGMALSIAGRSAQAATKDAVQRVQASLGRVKRIVDGLLDFARAGARPLPGTRTDVAPVVAGLREELQPFAADQRAELRVEPFAPCAVACSAGVLLSVLSNLLRNALKYLGDGQARVVTLRVRQRRGAVLFEVQDTGPGIDIGLGHRVFEPYVRGKHPAIAGIGLGLATVKRLVEAHEGTVGLRPASGGGSVFWFELVEAPLQDVVDEPVPASARSHGV